MGENFLNKIHERNEIKWNEKTKYFVGKSVNDRNFIDV